MVQEKQENKLNPGITAFYSTGCMCYLEKQQEFITQLTHFHGLICFLLTVFVVQQ